VFHERAAIEILRHKIGGIVGSWNLDNLQLLSDSTFLYPQVLDFEMPELPQSVPCCDPNGRAGIAVYATLKAIPEILSK